MAHDVLISYSSRDKLQADAICNRLESRGIRCWIAPRDVGLGEYAEKIVEAIEEARIMVLVYSANADQSHQVRREVERAVSKGTTIVPVRIEDHEMSKAFELYVGSMHWLDAITPPLEEHIDKLADQLQALLGGQPSAPKTASPPAASASPAPPTATAAAATPPAAPPPSPAAAQGGGDGRRKLVAAGLAGAAVVLLLLFLLGRSDDAPEDEASSAGEVVELTTDGPAAPPATVEEESDPDTVPMTFENETGVPVTVAWVNYDGNEEVYETLAPGARWEVDTYEGHVWVVRSTGEGEPVITECEAPDSASTCEVLLVNGYNVAWVEFEQPGTDVTGSFEQARDGSWEELDADGRVRFLFAETGRDEWSVYLEDSGRDVEIQIDLYTDRVMYSDASSAEPRLLYTIVDASD